MPTMIVRQEVEATPALVAGELRKFCEATKNDCFSYDCGTAIYLRPDYINAIAGLPDMPVIVVSRGQGTRMGLVAVYKTDGNITLVFVTDDQVESLAEV